MFTPKRMFLFCPLALACATAQAGLDTGYSFFDNASLTGKIRTVNYYVENTYQHDHADKYPKHAAGAWTAGLQVNVQSGYLYDFLAVGGSFYGVAKINMDESKMKDSYQLLGADNKGFTKAGQAYVDLKYGDTRKDPLAGNFKAGRQLLYTGLISSSGSRSVPSTWQGYNLSTKIYGADFKLAYVDKMSLRNEEDFNKLVNFEGKQIDNIIGGELGYTFDLPRNQSLNLKYRNAFSKDFLQAHNGFARWTMPVSDVTELSFEGQYYYTRKDGNLWTGEAWGKPAFKDDASAMYFSSRLKIHGWDFQLAVAHIKAEGDKITPESGYQRPRVYYYDLGKNTHGIWGVPTSGFAEDMIYDGETVWMGGIGYDFTSLGAKGLKLGYRFHYGSGMEVTDSRGKNKSVSEHEHDVYANYAFPQELLKGLVFKLEYGMYRNDRELREAISKEENDLRVWLDYNFVLL